MKIKTLEKIIYAFCVDIVQSRAEHNFFVKILIQLCWIRFIYVCFILFRPCIAQTSDTTFTVSGIITNYKPDKTIFMAIYSSEKDFKQRNFYKKLRFRGDKLPADSMRYSFTGVAPGEYIIAAYQDLNGDIKLNMGFFGPTEPYQMYRPHHGIFAPKFSNCKFLLTGDIDTANIVLK